MPAIKDSAACPRLRGGRGKRLASLCLPLSLAACGTTERMIASPFPMEDYRARHPIILADGPRTLEIFVDPRSGRFDQKSAARLGEFAELYRQFGRGPITVMPPAGPSGPPPVGMIRNALLRSGARGQIVVTPYPAGPNPIAPVRMSFSGLRAAVGDRCGQWPRDLALGSGAGEDWSNKPYWNFGCAYQTAFAAQVADPRDLVSPQAETPADTEIRTGAIESLRRAMGHNSKDPGENWRPPSSAISDIGGY